MKPLHIVVNAGNGCANVVFSRLKEHLPIHFTEMLMQPQRIMPQRITQQGQLLQEPLPAQP